MTTNPMPRAKTERLIVRELDGETLVYDLSRDAASCSAELFAVRVWRECDETSVAAIAAVLGEDGTRRLAGRDPEPSPPRPRDRPC